ncbi:MAG: O-antigen ligase family protein, partial [Candidatus Binatia bacterium]
MRRSDPLAAEAAASPEPRPGAGTFDAEPSPGAASASADKSGGEALFAVGLALPLFAGGNTFLALEPKDGMAVFALVSTLVVGWLVHSQGPTATSPRGPVLVAHVCLLGLGVWWMAALAFRPSGPRAFLEAQGIFCGILLFTMLSRRPLAPDAIGRFVRGLTVGTLGTAALSQYQYWIAGPRTAPLAEAAGLTVITDLNANFYNANCYAAFLAAVSLVVATRAIADRDPVARIALPILLVTLLLSKSKAAIALFALGAIVLAGIAGWRPRALRNRFAIDALWVLLPAAAGAAAALVDLNELWGTGTLGRLAIWRAGLAMFQDHWLGGVGLGRFADFFVEYRVNTYYTRYPHNFLLEIAAELGVLGLVGAVGFLAAAFAGPVAKLAAAARTRAVSPLSAAIVVASSILVVHGLVDIDWHAPANPILLFTLLGA